MIGIHGRSRRGVVGVLLVIGILAAPGADLVGPSGAAGAAEGTATARVEKAGIAFEYPEEWTVVRGRILSAKDLTRMIKANPQYASAIDEMKAAAKSQDFMAADVAARAQGAFVANVGVVSPDPCFLPPNDLTGFRVAVSSRLAEVGVTVHSAERIKIDGRPAYVLDATQTVQNADGGSSDIRQGQVFIPRGSTCIVVTISHEDTEAGHAAIQAIEDSIRLL